ncbi:hypothetical protein [Pseudovibrio brasiliensis]|uniref:Uncharacterized protein n=1 Tax=Pseudovibrio brasiliensis TaxID=1898042 RepID=A0ABX8AGZ6_9HYPH|nr:hypothetical protein [Pseudovibrio brasiliensis]QUS54359.1 hypothetical protein KGB56_13230 [Pseudovibrio brasiliensis]
MMTGTPHHSAVWPLQARLAASLLNPLAFAHDDHLAETGLELGVLRGLSGHDDFRRPLNTHVSRLLGLNGLAVDVAATDKLSGSDQARLALMLCSLGAEDFGGVLRIIAIARVHDMIGRLVLKSHCQRMEALFGEDVFDIAIRDVAFFFGTLGYSAEEDVAFDQLCSGSDEEALQALTLIGAEGILAFVSAVDEKLEPLVRLRFSNELNEKLSARLQVMRAEQQEHFVQYLRRRLPQWRAFID